MAPKFSCPHCGCSDTSLIQPWREPISQIEEEATRQHAAGEKWYCECCGKDWVVQKLPFGEGPDGFAR